MSIWDQYSMLRGIECSTDQHNIITSLSFLSVLRIFNGCQIIINWLMPNHYKFLKICNRNCICIDVFHEELFFHVLTDKSKHKSKELKKALNVKYLFLRNLQYSFIIRLLKIQSQKAIKYEWVRGIKS